MTGIGHEEAGYYRSPASSLRRWHGRMQAGGEGAGACSAGAVDRPRTDRCRQHCSRGHRRAPIYRPISASACWAASSRVPSTSEIWLSEGQMVAAIDPTALELAVQSAKAELSESQGPACERKRDGGAKTDPDQADATTKADAWTTPSRRAPAPKHRPLAPART